MGTSNCFVQRGTVFPNVFQILCLCLYLDWHYKKNDENRKPTTAFSGMTIDEQN